MSRSNEPIWWSLFAAGGVIAAFVIPILLIITGIVIPFSLVGEDPFTYNRIYNAVTHPFIKLILLIIIALPIFHWAHRFRFMLIDLGLKKAKTYISVFCYGSAIISTILAIIVLWRF